MILKCNCKHDYQDKRYGPSRRVHNTCTKGGKTAYRCTVCSDVKELQKGQVSKDKGNT